MLQVNYHNTENDQIYENAILKVHKIILSEKVVEKYVSVDDSLHLTYVKQPEASAMIYVYPDKESRERYITPLDVFTFTFDYDINEGENIYKSAYIAIQELNRFSGSEFVDC